MSEMQYQIESLFTPQFLAFYDPNNDFTPEEHPALLTWLCEGRSDAEDLTDRIRIGSRVLACEMAHTLLISKDDLTNARGLGLEESELVGCIDEAEFDAQATVKSMQAAVSVFRQNHPQYKALLEAQDPTGIVLYGAMASVITHRNQEPRENGGEFSEHPRVAAAIVDISTSRANRNRHLPDEDLKYRNITMYIDYRHDGLEDMMSGKEGERNKTFLRKDEPNLTPLVDFMSLKELRYEESEAYYVATGLRRVTKTVGYSGRRWWEPYIEELSRPAPEAVSVASVLEGLVTLAKRGEMRHNARLDPKKPPKRRLNETEFDFSERKERHMRKKNDYDWADMMLRDYLRKPVGFAQLVGVKVGSVRKADLQVYFARTDRLPAILTRDTLLSAYDRSSLK